MDIDHWLSDTVLSVASKIAYAASGAVILIGSLTLQEWVAVVGILTATMTFFVNWHYQRKRTRLMEQLVIDRLEAAGRD